MGFGFMASAGALDRGVMLRLQQKRPVKAALGVMARWRAAALHGRFRATGLVC